MEFLHGSADCFQNFYKSRNQHISNVSNICKYCDSEVDSTEHQLFYCFALDDPNRQELTSEMLNVKNYLAELLFNGNSKIHGLFYNRVQFIDSIDIDQDV